MIRRDDLRNDEEPLQKESRRLVLRPRRHDMCQRYRRRAVFKIFSREMGEDECGRDIEALRRKAGKGRVAKERQCQEDESKDEDVRPKDDSRGQ